MHLLGFFPLELGISLHVCRDILLTALFFLALVRFLSRTPSVINVVRIGYTPT